MRRCGVWPTGGWVTDVWCMGCLLGWATRWEASDWCGLGWLSGSSNTA